jgi:alkanesulfonate monooxygenase SsuD/methylene tetrahydromethanopterin reductase-like flavin-dependent oxidoreductase (luciferase family)
VIPPTSIEETREEALRHVNVPGLLAWANKAKFAVKPPSGHFESVEDLEGQLIVGSPDEAVAEIKKFQDLGTQHLVFDFRFKFDRFFDQIELLGREVLPQLRG